MAEKIEIIDGKLKVTVTPDETISTMERDEVVGKIAEAQTKVDHLQLDLAAAEAEVTKWDNYLKEIDK
jgi:hypothetical protein